ncbi:MAG: glutamine--tRNA ligase/YqeY domain fusion protein [Gemmatimonadota bacterium]|nr:glutamine--tRNA ligase/YqeY domain fusion protein [Gemmatimonadota bacterium]
MDETKDVASGGTDFIRQIVREDLADGTYDTVVTRFPPEPNGYMHIGHAKSVCLNFGIAEEFGGRCHLRFDDTNPEKENEHFVRQFQDDVRWLGFDWGEHLYFASDYFERMYECAEVLIRKGLAYVDSQPNEAIREGRGTVTEPGVESPYRERTVDVNLDMFRRMRAGEYGDGAHVLRAKIDMASPNMLLRDPVLYRIRHASHYRRGDAWCIYPLYDYAHCLEDAFEGITHSLCTLEFANNRELYDWVLENVGFEEPRPHQYEFARLELEHAVLSKRRIAPLVAAGVVSGWDDPRLSTVAGIRRRGVPPEAVRFFCDMIGVARTSSIVDGDKFAFAVRETLNTVAPRVMAVLDPVRVVITDFPEDRVDVLDAPYFPPDVAREGSRDVPFCREVLIEREDFAEDPPKGFRRLVPGGKVRLRHACVIRCDEVIKDDEGRIVELRCSHDPATIEGGSTEGGKVKGAIHWVSARHALEAEVRLYGPLFRAANLEPDDDVAVPEEEPDEDDLLALVDPESLKVLRGARVEPSVTSDAPDTRYQFERTGYFWRDPVDGRGDELVFNRVVPLKSSWGRKPSGREEKRAQTHGRAARDASEPQPGSKPRISERRAQLRAEDPELAAHFERYRSELGLAPEQADVLTGSHAAVRFFEAALAEHDDTADVAGWIVTELRGLLEEDTPESLPFEGEALGRLAALVDGGRVSRRAAKDVLARMVEQGGAPEALIEEMGLTKLSDAETLEPIVDRVIAEWPEKVAEYRAGNKNLLGLFIGQVMEATQGAADPRRTRALLTERLDESPS